jgi:hypothetical protein
MRAQLHSRKGMSSMTRRDAMGVLVVVKKETKD